MTTKTNELGLSAQDKTPKPGGWGFDFHHTEPQRRVPCALGDMLCPRSADDISPITPEAMASVQAAIALLANLVADRDHNLFLACSDRQAEMVGKARDILSVARALTGILRVRAAMPSIVYLQTHDGACHEVSGSRLAQMRKDFAANQGGPTLTDLVESGCVGFLGPDGELCDLAALPNYLLERAP